MNLKKYFLLENYVGRIKILQKKLKIKKLERLKFSSAEIIQIWKINPSKKFDFDFSNENDYPIFGIKVNLEEEINWHQDRFSGFVYPLKRFDKLMAEQWFDKGIELKFPWELSRFYFAVGLGQKYLVSKDELYYQVFKRLALDWIDKNPFLYGVNWLSTMEIAVRSINWIVSINFFSELVKNDVDFKKIITQSLIQHTEYIYSFPEIYENGLTTNHTTACYAGLLFLAISFQQHAKSKIWMEAAVKGLENCIKEQVYDDGVDFEGSIPYHRLVLELFAYSAITALSNNIPLSNEYYKKLFKMFEFTAAYIDEAGNAPQVGDNDSGRILIFNEYDENSYKNGHNHSYLLALGEHIFDYKFRSKCINRAEQIISFLPLPVKSKTVDLSIKPRDTEKSIFFESGGAYLLKNNNFDLLISSFPLGQNGQGGHNHLDSGSFTLSINGKPIIVDPGTYFYSTARKERDRFRSYSFHNTIYNSNDDNLDMSENGYWSLKKYYDDELIDFSDNNIYLKITFINDEKPRFRKFELIKNKLIITDKYEGRFFSRLNFHPSIGKITQVNNNITIANFNIVITTDILKFDFKDYDYSSFYGKKSKSKCLIIESNKILKYEIRKVL